MKHLMYVLSYFLNKYLAKIKSIYAPDEIWLWGSRAYGLLKNLLSRGNKSALLTKLLRRE